MHCLGRILALDRESNIFADPSLDAIMDHAYRELEEAYFSLVNLFEGNLKDIYQVVLRSKHPKKELLERETDEEREWAREREVGTSFQQIKRAEEAFRKLGVDLLGDLSHEQRDCLELAFAKYHALRGHSELVDKKYRKRVRPFPRYWRRVSLDRDELKIATELVERIVIRAASRLGVTL